VATHEKTGWGEWDGAVYLLTAPAIAGKTAPYIDHERQGIDWSLLLVDSAVWSSGERWLVEAAHGIWWSSGEGVSLGYAVNALDDENFRRFVDAMRLARGESLEDRTR
jgi:hypothetical protein